MGNDTQKQKCSYEKHKAIDAVIYCQECKVFMCNKCQTFHSELCQNHNIIDDINEIEEEYCKEKNHTMKLDYFCKTHNQLCCAACLSKLENKGNGQHKDCIVCAVEEIVEEKKSKINENIKYLEELNKTLEQSIDHLKKLLAKINNDKEEIKLKIQGIFRKIKNVLNERENEILLELDKQFDKIYFNEELIKKSEKLPSEIKMCLSKKKKYENIKNIKFNSLLNYLLNVENIVKEVNEVNENINKENLNKDLIKFYPKEKDELNIFLEKIKTFGNIYYYNLNFKICPPYIEKSRLYSVTGENHNILTKTGTDLDYMGTICENQFEKDKIYRWKIKILKSKENNINVGVAPIDFDIHSSNYKYGWYLYIKELTLWSGPPHNYNGKPAKLNQVKNNEIILIMNMNKGSLKFIIDGEDKGDSYINIPLDKPLSPAVLLSNKNDSVEIVEC